MYVCDDISVCNTVKTGVFSYTLSGVYWNTFLHWGVLLHS